MSLLPPDGPPSRPATPRPDPLPPFHLDPVRTLAFRTPVQDQPGLADAKAAAVLTLWGILFAITARVGDSLMAAAMSHGWEPMVLLPLLGLFAVLSVGVVVQAFRTIAPRFPRAPESLAFFGDIARLPLDVYVDRVMRLSLEQVVEHVLVYNHTLAAISVVKYRQLGRCVRFFRAAFVCWAAMFAALAVAAALR